MLEIKAPAKVNIFLKITGYKNGYHTLLSRFMRVDTLYDTITFVPGEYQSFTIEGCKGVDIKSNTIYKAYKALNSATGDLDILDFFYKHKVVVKKQIPQGAGLGGGSSDAASFMRLVHKVCNLKLSIDELAEIGSTIGADIPFFIYGYPSANVSGFGEIVEPFDEEALDLDIYTPPLSCNTAEVYKIFKDKFLDNISILSFSGWENIKSKEILSTIKSPEILNDLYRPALLSCPKLKEYAKDDYFFSGSGSSFFRLKD